MPDDAAGMLSWTWVERQMASARNYWIATARADGSPHCAPVWGAWVEGAFYFGSDRQSVKAVNLRRDKRAVVHLDSGDEVVILQGELLEAQVSADMLRRISAAYVEKYKLDPELDESSSQVYRLTPRKVMAWIERDFPASVTSWIFDG